MENKQSKKSKKACKNSKTYKDPQFGDTCKQWIGYKCDGFNFSDELKENCPKSCKVC